MSRITLKPPFRITGGDLMQPLTDTEGRLMCAFMFRDGLSTKQMAEVIWPEEWDWPLTYAKCIHVKLWQLRKRLEPFGWTITHARSGTTIAGGAKRFLEPFETVKNTE